MSYYIALIERSIMRSITLEKKLEKHCITLQIKIATYVAFIIYFSI